MQIISSQSNSQLNVFLYKQLNDEIGSLNPVLFIHDENGISREPLLQILGQGSNKTAFEIARGRALILPNIDHENVKEFAACWGRMVEEEVRVSKLAQEVGLIGSRNKPVNISSKLSTGSIPAYICETFEQLSRTEGWLVIDAKASNSSIWKKGTSFFSCEAHRLNPEMWHCVLDPLLTDIVKIIRHGIPCEGDARNFAVIKAQQGFQVRYFGFDFSDMNSPLKMCDWGRDERTVRRSIDQILSRMLDDILFVEFGWKYFDKQDQKIFKTLKEQLIVELIPICFSRFFQNEASDSRSEE